MVRQRDSTGERAKTNFQKMEKGDLKKIESVFEGDCTLFLSALLSKLKGLCREEEVLQEKKTKKMMEKLDLACQDLEKNKLERAEPLFRTVTKEMEENLGL